MTLQNRRNVLRRPNPGPRPGAVLDPQETLEALREIASVAKENGVHAALAGGLAMQVYGSDRFTKDIDVLCDEDMPQFPGRKRLTFGGRCTKTSKGLPLDLIMRDDVYTQLYDAALNTARRIRGYPLPVATPEYLVAMKLAAAREKDVLDIETLVILNAVDVKKARRVISETLGYFAADEFMRTVELAEWKRGRE